MPPIFLTSPWQLQCNLDHEPLGWYNFRELMFSLVLIALDLNPSWKSPESSFQPNTLNSSERSSQDPTKFSSGGNSLLLWPALGQLTDSLKENVFWSIEGQEVLWTQSGEELEFSMGTSQTCCYSPWNRWLTGETQRGMVTGICANRGVVTQPANSDQFPFGHKIDPAVGCCKGREKVYFLLACSPFEPWPSSNCPSLINAGSQKPKRISNRMLYTSPLKQQTSEWDRQQVFHYKKNHTDRGAV